MALIDFPRELAPAFWNPHKAVLAKLKNVPPQQIGEGLADLAKRHNAVDWDLFDVDKLDGLAQAEARQKSVEDEIRTKVIRIDRANRIRWPTTPITSPRKERSTRKLRRNLSCPPRRQDHDRRAHLPRGLRPDLGELPGEREKGRHHWLPVPGPGRMVRRAVCELPHGQAQAHPSGTQLARQAGGAVTSVRS